MTRLAASGFDVTAAAWVLVSEEDRWYLYVATKVVDTKGPATAYREAYGVLGVDNPWISVSEVKLIGADNPIARDILDIQRRYPGTSPTRIRRTALGSLAIQEASVYPPPWQLEILATGKEDVLRRLEAEAIARAGKPGGYMLARDPRGNLVAFIAGHTFVGGGTLNLGGKHLVIEGGILTEIVEAK